MHDSDQVPTRPLISASTSVPDDKLPTAVIAFNNGNRDAVRHLINYLSPESISAFIQSNGGNAFKSIGNPYGAYDAELPTDPVAQIWQKDPQDNGSIVVVRRIGDGHFRVQAREGANVLVLYSGDDAKGIQSAALLCVTLLDQQSQFMKAGDKAVFEGAVFLEASQASAEFGHIKDHILRQCTHCTASGAATAALTRT